ncbi:MAG: hypothetical protein IH840_02730 [Candidatus Heimdallarchaeota archaeon]|nr:hypothetical protein [Candidatus Heimdallarchaeota archaeon]
MMNIIELRKILVETTIDLNEIDFSPKRETRLDCFYSDGRVTTQVREPDAPPNRGKILIFQMYNNTLFDFDYKLAEELQAECKEASNQDFTSPHDHLNRCSCSQTSIRTLVTGLYTELGRLIDDYFIQHQIDKKIITQPRKIRKHKPRQLGLVFELELEIADNLCQVVFDITGRDKTEAEDLLRHFTITWLDETDKPLEFSRSREFLGNLLYFLSWFRPYTLRNMKYFVQNEIIKMSVRELFEKYSTEKPTKNNSNGFNGKKSGTPKLTPSSRYYYQEVNKVKDAVLRYLKSMGLWNQAGGMIVRPIQEVMA